MQADKTNYYEVLEVKVQATQEEILRAYNSALIAYSEESVAIYSLMSSSDCKEVREKIDEAYTILGSPEKRREYDRLRGFNQNEVAIEMLSNDQKSKLPSFDFNEENISMPAATNNNYGSNFGSTDRKQTTHSILNIKHNSSVDIDAARKKFSLSYEPADDMENKIATRTDFDGKFLKEIREYKNVSLEKMAEMTRIMKAYILHLENEDFSKLPATAYIRGFIFQYAKHLKLNPDLVSNSYIQRVKQVRGEIAKAL